MNSQAFNPDVFPAIPAHRFLTAPIFMEPIIGSGERLCVLAAAHGPEGSVVAPLIAPEVAECLYGDQADSLLGFMRIARESLQQHFEQGCPIGDWSPPFSGLSVGAALEAYADSPAMAARGVARMHASLCHLSALGGAAEREKPARDDALKHWIEQAQDAAKHQNPLLLNRLNQSVELIGKDPIRVQYATETKALCLSLLSPAKLANRTNDARLKLWSLSRLPTQYRRRQLVLGVPRDDAIEMAEPKVREKIHQRINAFRAQTADMAVDVMAVYTAEEAGQRIIELDRQTL